MKKLSLKHSKNYRYLLLLLSSLISDTKPPKPNADTDWASVFYLAKEHSLLGMISYAVEKLDDDSKPSKVIMAKLKQLQREELILESNIQFECEKLQSEFDKRNIRVLFLKGMMLKHYYPLCSMRSMSDVDILYREEDKEKIKELFKEQEYKQEMDINGELDFIKPPFYHYELHPRLEFSSGHICKSLSQAWLTSQTIKSSMFSTLSLENTYLYMLEHLAKHMESAGAGIRMIMDVFVFLKAERENLDFDIVNSGLRELNLTDFAKRIEQLTYSWFLTDAPDTESITAEFILNSSTFGFSSNAIVQTTIRKEHQSGKKQNGFKILFRKIFPEYKYISGRFPSAKKLRFLYPFYIPAYWCMRLFKDRNINTTNFGNYFIKTDSDKAQYLLKVMKDMGLSERI